MKPTGFDEKMRMAAIKRSMFIEGDSLENNVLRALVNLNDRLANLCEIVERLAKFEAKK